MSFKTILVPIEQHDRMNATLETALLLARKFDSYVEGFALRVELPTAFAVGDVAAVPIPALEHDIAENEQRGRSLFENFMQAHGVPRGADAKALSSGWLDNAPEGDHFVGSHGRLFDVIVLGRPGRDPQGPRMTTLEAGLFDSGRPVLIAPPDSPRSLATNVLIAWNCSTEQARTTADAMPLLRMAKRVTICTVEGATVAGPSGEQMARSLKVNGIDAEPITLKQTGKRNAGETLLAKAAELGCDLIIKGAYTQSRLRQMIFGGTTRHILANAKLPVLMAH